VYGVPKERERAIVRRRVTERDSYTEWDEQKAPAHTEIYGFCSARIPIFPLGGTSSAGACCVPILPFLDVLW